MEGKVQQFFHAAIEVFFVAVGVFAIWVIVKTIREAW